MLKKTGFLLFITFILSSFHLKNAYSIEGILNGSISEMYDDNVLSSSEEKEYDFITEVMLALGIMDESKTTSLRLLGRTTQQIYYNRSELNKNLQSAELNIAKEFTSTDRITIADRFAHYPEPRDFQEQFGMTGGRTGYCTNTITTTYIKDILSDLTANVHYTNTYTKILSNDNRLNDSILHNGGIATGYGINPYDIVSFFYNYTYWKTLTDNEIVNKKTIIHDGGLGYERLFTKQLSLNLKGSVEYVITDYEKKKNIFGALSLTDQIDERNNFNLSVSRRYEIIPLTNQVYDIWNLSLTFKRELSYFLFFSSSVFYQYGNTVSDIIATKSKLIGIKTNLTYRLFSDHITTNIEYIYTNNKIKQTSPTNFQAEYDRNQIRLAIVAAI